MKNIFTLLSLSIFLLCTSCASIVSKSRWPFEVSTDPTAAKLVITNKKGEQVFTGKTPNVVMLKSGAGFFSKESYTVTMTMAGYEPRSVNVRCKLNGWYFGNLLFGGVIGMLIVDPATGAMYRLNTEGLSENLKPVNSTGAATLKIIDKQSLSPAMQKNLVQL